MKKMNNKGFMLVEALVVCTFVVSVLIYFYVQFKNIDKSFETSYAYNTINDLYAVNNVSKYLGYLYKNNTSFKNMINNGTVKSATEGYKIIYNSGGNDDIGCSSTIYCKNLMNSINVKYVILVDNDLTNLLTKIDSDAKFSEKLRDYIKQLSYEGTSSPDYRIITEFSDGTFASLKKRFKNS